MALLDSPTSSLLGLPKGTTSHVLGPALVIPLLHSLASRKGQPALSWALHWLSASEISLPSKDLNLGSPSYHRQGPLSAYTVCRLPSEQVLASTDLILSLVSHASSHEGPSVRGYWCFQGYWPGHRFAALPSRCHSLHHWPPSGHAAGHCSGGECFFWDPRGRNHLREPFPLTTPLNLLPETKIFLSKHEHFYSKWDK